MVMAHTFDRNCILIHAKAPSNLFCCVHPCHTDQHILLGFSLRYSNLGIRSDFIYNSSIKVGLAHDPPSLAPVSKHHSQSRVNISLSQHSTLFYKRHRTIRKADQQRRCTKRLVGGGRNGDLPDPQSSFLLLH